MEGSKKIGIMQPYFFPYIGYFQLMHAVDEFVVYDNIKYTKKGWINRNRILNNGKDVYITLPLKKDSDYLHVCDRELSESWHTERRKMLNLITASYQGAPQYAAAFPVIHNALLYEEMNLFAFIYHSLQLTKDYLGIKTPLVVSSEIKINHDLRAEQKIMAITKARNADMYINPIGGTELYNKDAFKDNSIRLHFLKTSDVHYSQFKNNFLSSLSIIDVMMFNSKEAIQKMLAFYALV